MLRTARAFALSIGAMLAVGMPGAAPVARAQIRAIAPCPACGYRESLLTLRANVRELVERRCL